MQLSLSQRRSLWIDLQLKRTYEIEQGKLLDYFDSEVISNDDLLTKYLAKNKQAVLGRSLPRSRRNRTILSADHLTTT